MNDIRVELGIPSQSPFSLENAENEIYVSINPCSQSIPSSNNPASISEWYGYCHTCTCLPTQTPTPTPTPTPDLYYYYDATQTDCFSTSGSYIIRSLNLVFDTFVCCDDNNKYEISGLSSGTTYVATIVSESSNCNSLIC
jgi:hypothetical protein